MATLQEMIPTIIAKTQQRKITWEPLGEGYFARVGKNLGLQVESNSGIMFELSLVNEDGETIENVSGIPSVRNLHELVRRQALRIDDTLADLKKELDKL